MKVKDDKDKFELTLDVSQFKPEELKVSTVNNVLSIEGKHEEEVNGVRKAGHSDLSSS